MSVDFPIEVDAGHFAEALRAGQLTPDDIRLISEDMAKAGMDANLINDELKALGVAPIATSPAALARRELSRLKSDPEWVAKLDRGEGEATTAFNRLTLAISQGGGPERPTYMPDDYRLPMHDHAAIESMDEASREQFDTEHREWAARLGLDPRAAAAIVEFQLDGAARYARMSNAERLNFAQAELETLSRILDRAGDSAARIASANRILTERGGKAIDIERITQQVGAKMGLELVLQAEQLSI